MVNICAYYRGRLDIPSAMEMSVADIQALKYIMWKDMNDPNKQEQKKAEVVEDALVHGEV